ncbi:hypothetical protein AB0L40_06315 [Patulibacter sp. NPDC049589]|uniref:hypothetical protein n=1 Tax=Patulibacter sp. NPDC049589 TaxID=3154731 RepID=UPI0034476888
MAGPLSTSLRAAACVAAIAAGAGLIGCGGDDDAGPSAAVTGTTASPATTTAPRGATTTEATPGTGTTTEQVPPGGTTDATPPTGADPPSAVPPDVERRVFPNVVPLKRVPQTADRDADATTRRIAERWFSLVRQGKDAQAGALMANGSRFANVAVALLPDRAARTEAAESLPCGAVPTAVGGARGGYVVLTLKLVNKAGQPPCDGAGNPVAVSLHVKDGKIDDWVRVGADDAPINQGTPV